MTGAALPPRNEPGAYSTRNDTRRFTRHSVTLPPPSVTTLVSFTHAPLMFFTVSAHLARPLRTASSTLVGEDALTSMTFTTDMADSCMGPPQRRPGRASSRHPR